MQMILKSMGVKVDKDDMESYAGEIDEAGAGKFTLAMFCQIAARFMIEVDEDASGTLDFDEFQEMMMG